MYLGILIVTIISIAIYVMEVRKIKFNVRLLIIISAFSALGYILNLFKFITMPQGGSITLFSMLPVMIISHIYGIGAGLTSGLLLGFLKTLDGATILNPFQFFLDYLLSNMCLGFANMFGRKNKVYIFLGCLLSGIISVMFNVLSGVLFYGEFAPSGMNPWIYSLIYNFSSLGLEAVLTSVVMLFIPLNRIKKAINNKA